MQGLQ
jgi:hypothetical protein